MKGEQSNEVIKETGKSRWIRIIRSLGIGFMAAVLAGVLVGLLLRLVMGIIAFFFPHLASGFSLTGTLMLVILGIALTLANSILYTVIFQNSRKSSLVKGLNYGLFSLFVFGTPMFLSNPNNELFGPQAPLGVSLFSALFIIGGLLLAYFIHKIGKWVGHSNGRLKLTYVSFIILILPAAVMLVNMFAEIFYEMLPKISSNLSQFL